MKPESFNSVRRRRLQFRFIRMLAIIFLLVAVWLSSKARPAPITSAGQENQHFQGVPGKDTRVVPQREAGK